MNALLPITDPNPSSRTFGVSFADNPAKAEEAYGRLMFHDDPDALECFLMFLKLSPEGRDEALVRLRRLVNES